MRSPPPAVRHRAHGDRHMNSYKKLDRRWLVTGFAMVLLLSAAACGSDPTLTAVPPSTPTAAPTSTPTAVPTPTATVAPTPTATIAPTPTPTVAPTPTATALSTPMATTDSPVNDLISSAGEALVAMSTVTFRMIDELESGTKFFGTTLKTVEGEIKSPDSFRMTVDVVAPALGFLEIEMMAIGEEAYMKFSADAPWTPLPLEQVPFNFGGIGVTVSELLSTMKDAAITGRESVEGIQTVRVEGIVVSEELSDLITSVDPGYPVTLTFWFDEEDHILQQFRIAGQVFADDAPETKRLLNFSNYNAPVDIQLPDVASGS